MVDTINKRKLRDLVMLLDVVLLFALGYFAAKNFSSSVASSNLFLIWILIVFTYFLFSNFFNVYRFVSFNILKSGILSSYLVWFVTLGFTLVIVALNGNDFYVAPILFAGFLGEMSIVGPRPHVPQLDKEYQSQIDWYYARYRIKPGITGWAQVNGYRGETNENTMNNRIVHDLYYISHWNLLLDFKIILLTFFVGFTHPKAY